MLVIRHSLGFNLCPRHVHPRCESPFRRRAHDIGRVETVLTVVAGSKDTVQLLNLGIAVTLGNSHVNDIERRASLIATTNEDNFIRSTEGTRRYLVIDLKDTVDLDAFPLPYEGAYAQALYLLDHGFQPKPTHDESQLITEHNRRFEEPNDCEEAILTFLKQPDTLDNAESLSAGDIMHELSFRGFRGREYNANSIGKAMKKLGFERKMIRGINKYLIAKIDPDLHNRENKEESKQFVPEIF